MTFYLNTVANAEIDSFRGNNLWKKGGGRLQKTKKGESYVRKIGKIVKMWLCCREEDHRTPPSFSCVVDGFIGLVRGKFTTNIFPTVIFLTSLIYSLWFPLLCKIQRTHKIMEIRVKTRAVKSIISYNRPQLLLQTFSKYRLPLQLHSTKIH